MFLLSKSVLESVLTSVEPKNWNINLQHICFDYDKETKELNIVGANSISMIIVKMYMDDTDKQSFCEKHFTNRKMYKITKDMLKGVRKFALIGEIDGKLCLDNTILETYEDGIYPNYKAVVPQKLEKATKFIAFKPDYMKNFVKAFELLGNSDVLITCPETDIEYETKSPYVWKHDTYEIDTKEHLYITGLIMGTNVV